MQQLLILLIALLLPSLAQARAVFLEVDDDIFRDTGNAFEVAFGDTSPDAAPVTTELDRIAGNGVVIKHFVAAGTCSVTRAELLFGFHSYRPNNLYGTNTSPGQPTIANTAVELNPYGQHIVSRAHDLGFEVYFGGKLHLEQRSWGRPGFSSLNWDHDSFLLAMGVDAADNVITGGGTGGAGPTYLDIDAADADDGLACLGFNNWESCNLANTCSTHTTYAVEEIYDDVLTHYQANLADDWLYLVMSPAAHAPWKNEPCGVSGAQNDNVPGNSHPSNSPSDSTMYIAAVEDLDTRKGVLHAALNNGAGLTAGGADIVCTVGDNGIPNPVEEWTVCEDSYGKKLTNYPCGAFVYFACMGGGIESGTVDTVDSILTGLYTNVDVPKTLERLMGGIGRGSRDGINFGDCMLGTNGKTLANCKSHEVVTNAGFGPIGGADGTIAHAPILLGSHIGDFNSWQMGSYTLIGSVLHHLVTVFFVGTMVDWGESIYIVDQSTDHYLDSGTAALATTSPQVGHITDSDWVSGPSVDERLALEAMQRHQSAIARSGGVFKSSF